MPLNRTLRYSHKKTKNKIPQIIKDFIIPLLPVVVAIVGIMASTYMQYLSSQSQDDLKRFEVTFAIKQKAYASFMLTLSDSYDSAHSKNKDRLFKDLDQMETIFYSIEPFLDDYHDTRNSVYNLIQDYKQFCLSTIDGKLDTDTQIDSYLYFKQTLKSILYNNLFRDKVEVNLSKTRYLMKKY